MAAVALGLDRAVMVLAGQETIREVIAFPKTQSATDLMTGAPSPVDQAALDEVRIQLKLPPPDPMIDVAPGVRASLVVPSQQF